jgi:hypothetical protein
MSGFWRLQSPPIAILPLIVPPATGRVDAMLGAVVAKTDAGWVAGESAEPAAAIDSMGPINNAASIAGFMFRMGTIVLKS